jgi:recombination protein RecR
MVLHLLKQDTDRTEHLTKSLNELRQGIRYCGTCHMMGDTEVCSCEPHKRDQRLLCVVEDFRDVLAIQNTQQFNGLFHVLGGVISPMHGVGPSQLHIHSLLERLKNTSPPIEEVLLALPSTMEGDTTSFYLAKKIKELGKRVSSIARGVPIGSELEYTDEVTLGRSITERIVYSLPGHEN